MAVYGGAEVVIVKLVKEMQKRGHDISVATLTTDGHKEYDGINFILPKHKDEQAQYKLRSGSLSTLAEIYQIYKNLARIVQNNYHRYDVLHPHNFPAILACPTTKPIVFYCNEIPDLWHNQNIPKYVNPFLNAGRWGDRTWVRSKKAIAVVADSNMARLFRHRYLYEPFVVNYGIDGDVFSDNTNIVKLEQVRAKYQINEGNFNIVQTSMLSPSKQQLEIVKAVRIFSEREGSNIKVIFTGYRDFTHPYTIAVKRFLDENHMDYVFTDMGRSTRDELPYIYRLSNVSLFMGKGQGSWLSPFESLAAGCPTIVSPNLTCASIISDNSLGVVTTYTLNGLIHIYNNYHTTSEMTMRGREYVLNNLTWKKYGDKLEAIFKTAVRQC